MNKQISKLIDSSKKVITDCSLPNGAIVAANSKLPYCSKETKNYRFVWPRDGMYVCLAAKILDLNIQEKFFTWCQKAEGWKRSGLFYENYYLNGKKKNSRLQIDQNGSLLMALHDYCFANEKAIERFEKLITKSADALVKIWQQDHFTLMINDLWEERLCFPDLKENFTYSLAVCARGLELANELIPNVKWLQASRQMKKVLLKNFKNNFYRSFGVFNDEKIDSSLLGMAWPTKIVKADNEIMKNTVKLIEEKLVINFGVYRYENDRYDGWMYQGKKERKKGAGYWPLLNFWMTIYYCELGEKEKAMPYYKKVLADVENNYLPEQIFNNHLQVSVSPLAWSHAMFVIASRKMGLI